MRTDRRTGNVPIQITCLQFSILPRDCCVSHTATHPPATCRRIAAPPKPAFVPCSSSSLQGPQQGCVTCTCTGQSSHVLCPAQLSAVRPSLYCTLTFWSTRLFESTIKHEHYRRILIPITAPRRRPHCRAIRSLVVAGLAFRPPFRLFFPSHPLDPPARPHSPRECRMPFSSSKSNTRLPSNIPLRTLPHASASTSRSHDTHDTEETTSFLQAGAGAGVGAGVGTRAGSSHTGYRVDRPGSDSGDDTDSWVETGDIGDQFDAEDPLRARLNDTLDDSVLAGLKPRHVHPHHHHQSPKKEKKHVRIHDQATFHDHHGAHSHTGVVDKEAIEIPEVISLRPSKAQRLLSSIMPGSSKGFTGKPLMYVTQLPVCRPAVCVLGTDANHLPVTSRVYSYH